MSDVVPSPVSRQPDALPSISSQTDLRRRIGPLCHAIRIAAAAYAVWVFVQVIRFWGDASIVSRVYSRILGVELGDLPAWQVNASLGLHLIVWAFTAAACFCVWRLFSIYLAGQIFTRDGATWLWRIGALGLTAQVGDLLSRPLIAMILSAHMPTGLHMVNIFANPPDLLNLLFLCALIALAHIFRVATEIADEHSQIV